MRKILLFGKVGQVGWELRRTLMPMGEIVCLDRPDVELSLADSIRNHIKSISPDIIINAAAYTAVDKSEKEFDLAKKINADAPGVMAEEAKKLGALLVHYSTDYVYDGAKRTPYVETDKPNPLGSYAKTKHLGDEAIRHTGCNHLIFRLCWVYGNRGSNFLLTMQRLAKQKEKIKVVSDQIGCPTWSRAVAEVTSQAVFQVKNKSDAERLSGTYHLCSSGQTSWHGFAKAIVDLMPPEERKCVKVEDISNSTYPTPTLRPYYTVMSTQKLQDTFGLKLPNWYEMLKHVVEK
jgi:dTDP-4-dehydrorhamnose reductase